jgi:uncharacterized protein YdeI (YjbR/CyaY-like superfamily)
MSMTKTKISGGVVHTLPSDLQQALIASPEALKAWEDITPLARNEWICWTVTTKRQDTRDNHVIRTIAELKAGKRRPCCWAGCFHRGKERNPLDKRS